MVERDARFAACYWSASAFPEPLVSRACDLRSIGDGFVMLRALETGRDLRWNCMVVLARVWYGTEGKGAVLWLRGSFGCR